VIPTTAEIAKMGEMTKNSLDPQDAATQGLVDGQMAMRDFATEVNRITISALPAMGTAATAVADGMTAAMVEINKMINMGADKYAAQMLGQKPPEEVETGDRVVGAGAGALTGAATGALIGSFVPVIGTLIGAGIGAAVGGIAGGFAGDAATKAGMLPDWLDFDWGGGKAQGGDIKPRTAYMVGEQGPELLLSNMSGTVVPNDVLSGLSNMAGPAGTGMVDMDLGGSISALGGIGPQMDGTAQALAGNTSNNLAEAQLTRLDAIATTMARSVNIQTEILQAAHR
jgi:hypothetical protein